MTVDHDSAPVTLEVKSGVARLTLARPQSRNALSVELLEAVRDAVRVCEVSDVAALIIAAEGPAFCAGLDLRETAPERLRRGIELLVDVTRQFLAAPFPIIARVHGPVRAGGLGLVTAADFAVATDTVDFAFTEVRLGLAPAVISATVLPRLSSKDAARLFLTAERIDAATAAQMGLIDRAVAADQLDAAIDATVAPLLEAHPQGMRATKALLTAAARETLDRHADELVQTSFELFTSEAAQAAIAQARAR